MFGLENHDIFSPNAVFPSSRLSTMMQKLCYVSVLSAFVNSPPSSLFLCSVLLFFPKLGGVERKSRLCV